VIQPVLPLHECVESATAESTAEPLHSVVDSVVEPLQSIGDSTAVGAAPIETS
jgi:hypothetical protein